MLAIADVAVGVGMEDLLGAEGLAQNRALSHRVESPGIAEHEVGGTVDAERATPAVVEGRSH